MCQKSKTYNSRDSHVVTHRSSNLPFNCLMYGRADGMPSSQTFPLPKSSPNVSGSRVRRLATSRYLIVGVCPRDRKTGFAALSQRSFW
ncbi:hypothetical protein M438DRAFT_43364 [Aureobasidium pullulans EXF-150]|uniref:Uncharacterized protein n=1 Tax=Aureobasidium pullulans EXF-150 TaxID=1043002 RepID=A0A074Y8M0_AURPU|nr:uncharacterized protein M438DRAFT_43364 [Aureobasidium pullulans EXF-150]KEQ83186.1 hypothetical protein M438DRAFT_43364 [Aureobasidium pullulans EXF-150]